MVSPAVAIDIKLHTVWPVSENKAIATNIYQDWTRRAAAALVRERRPGTPCFWIGAFVDSAIAATRFERRVTGLRT
jgi:hypothetical protein